MPRRFDFISPGVSIREIDQSEVTPLTEDDGILLIGHAPQGPANVPTRVKNLEDFYTVFGRPISGKGTTSTDVWRDGNQQITTYAMYAAQAWLASGTSPVTFIRLLGEDQTAAKQTTGYTEAGWNSGQANSAGLAASNASAFGLFIMPSGSGGDLAGTLAAIVYTSGSSLALKGNQAHGEITGLNTLVQSNTSSGLKNTFTLVHSTSAGSTDYVVHFDRKQRDGYIRNVLNCNPQKINSTNFTTTETLFLGETFDEAATRVIADAGSGSAGKQFGIMLPLTDGTTHYSNRIKEATAAKTGWFINRHASPTDGYASYDPGSHEKLFRLCSLHEGEWFGAGYGTRIENLRLGNTSSPDSSFSVVIVNSDGDDIERFDNCSLNESTVDFVGKRIGDHYQTWNSTSEKYDLYGQYINKSDYVRVEMADDWKAGIADDKMLPFGVWGPSIPNSLSFTSASTTGGTNVLVSTAPSGSWDMGMDDANATILGNFARFSSDQLDMTCSLSWPSIKLTDENSQNEGNYTKNFVFGTRHMLDNDNKAKKTLWYSPDYKDLVRAMPHGLDAFSVGTKSKNSWIFSLDEIRMDDTNSSKFFFQSGSMASNASYTSRSGSADLLSKGVKQFNAPFFGGADGVDIMQVDPFSIANGLASGKTEASHYAYYTMKKAIDVISDTDLLNYDIVSIPGLINEGLTTELITMAEERADTLAIIDLDSSYRKSYENSGTETLGTSTQMKSTAESRDYNTSYAATYYPPVRLRDTAGTGDVTIVPASVAAIGAIGYSEANSQGPWFAPAGFNRGGIGILGGSAGPRVVGTIEHLTKKDRDDLYDLNINPIARFPAIGEIVIFGQKTLQQTPSALDRINVRRLMIYLKKRISKIANTILFDQNIRSTWLRFKDSAERVLNNVQSRFGITEYKLVLDETTTTADLVDRNIMYAKVFIKPARAIEFIAIDFIITKSGIEF